MAVGGLGAGDVQAIRDGLAAGRRPRVVFTASAGQIAGQAGQVVALTDPAESDDWLVVRFGKDELPFSPTDLQVAPRGAAARAAKSIPPRPKPVEPAPRPEPEFMIDKPSTRPGRRGARSPAGAAGGGAANGGAVSRSSGASEGGSAASGATVGPAGNNPAADAGGGTAKGGPVAGGAAGNGQRKADPDKRRAAAREVPAARRGEDTPGAPASATSDSPPATVNPAAQRGASAPAAARKPGARAGKAKAPAGLTVTLAYGDGEWTVSAQQGAKVLARPYEVRPAEALRIVSLVDVPGVKEAVQQILSAERAEAQGRADKLRAELAELEERLAELRDAG